MTGLPPHVEEIISDFALFDDWESRYSYLIDLGKALPDMPENLKTEETMVPGCTSRVWMIGETSSETGALRLQADSDAHIVRGLIAILLKIYSDRPPQELKGLDMHGVFGQLGLSSHLTPNRRNGFFSMVERIRKLSA